MHRQAQRTAVPERVYLGPVAGLPDERIVARDAAIVAQPQHFAALGIGILGIIAGGGQEKGSVLSKRNARSAGCIQHEDIPHVGERVSIPMPARQGHRSAFLIERLGVGEIYEAIFGKPGMESDIHEAMDSARQAGFAGEVRGRDTGDGFRIEHSMADDPQTAGALSHQHAAVGKKGETKWILERPGDRSHADPLAFRGVELHRQSRQLMTGQTPRRYGNVVLKRNLLLGRQERRPLRKGRAIRCQPPG